jgi:hypothetical protein
VELPVDDVDSGRIALGGCGEAGSETQEVVDHVEVHGWRLRHGVVREGRRLATSAGVCLLATDRQVRRRVRHGDGGAEEGMAVPPQRRAADDVPVEQPVVGEPLGGGEQPAERVPEQRHGFHRRCGRADEREDPFAQRRAKRSSAARSGPPADRRGGEVGGATADHLVEVVGGVADADDHQRAVRGPGSA